MGPAGEEYKYTYGHYILRCVLCQARNRISAEGNFSRPSGAKTDRPGGSGPLYDMTVLPDQQMPCHSMASATFRKPAIFAPAWMSPFMPYFSAASAQAA